MAAFTGIFRKRTQRNNAAMQGTKRTDARVLIGGVYRQFSGAMPSRSIKCEIRGYSDGSVENHWFVLEQTMGLTKTLRLFRHGSILRVAWV
jgi:hypothetical protein